MLNALVVHKPGRGFFFKRADTDAELYRDTCEEAQRIIRVSAEIPLVILLNPPPRAFAEAHSWLPNRQLSRPH